MNPPPKTKKNPEKPAPDWVPMAVVRRPHGIKGALKLHLFHPGGQALKKGQRVLLRSSTGKEVESEIRGIDGAGNLTLDSVSDRNQAESWRGAELFMARADFPDADDDEVYLVDLLGCQAHDQDGDAVGEVVGFSTNGPQDLLELDDGKGGIHLFPFVPELILQIDLEDRVLVLDIPDGLLTVDENTGGEGAP
jgi:16S rRNA processing protein RimM